MGKNFQVKKWYFEVLCFSDESMSEVSGQVVFPVGIDWHSSLNKGKPYH